MNTLTENIDWIESRIARVRPAEKSGKVVQVTGLVIESEGPEVSLGDVCVLRSPRFREDLPAEVVGFRDNRILLMPLADPGALHPGCLAVAAQDAGLAPVGDALVGRVIDGLGRPLDDLGPLVAGRADASCGRPPNPMARRPIDRPFGTGVRAVDTFTPVGVGQRLGIFAGSGVGKSTLLGMIARGSTAGVNVIALVGERGRELREFLQNDLGAEGLARSVVVVSTSDQPAPMRLRAAHLATTVAEHFRDAGQDVLFLMDSVTRYAMAQREIGLAVGEPPTSRGYTPSVFSRLPRLLERAGVGERGSITGFYTVLVDGDDLNEPVADAVRGILDGHLVLSRRLAQANHYPPVDVLASVSRLERSVSTAEERALTGEARDLLACFSRNEDLINIGAYAPGTDPKIDRARGIQPGLTAFLRQDAAERTGRGGAFQALKDVLSPGPIRANPSPTPTPTPMPTPTTTPTPTPTL